MFESHAPNCAIRAGHPLLGVHLFRLDQNPDERGSFTEIFQQHWESSIEPVQWSAVKSEPGVLRGMHLHLRHDELFCLIQGRCLVGLRDLRRDSPTHGLSCLLDLNADQMTTLTFPRGILHGWYFSQSSIHLQAVSETFSKYHDDDNWGCAWNDPDLQIPWGFSSAAISARAARFPKLCDLLSSLENEGIFQQPCGAHSKASRPE
jgi:dTDP-4-dehydrorhamnose 3,5-epimerase